MPPELLPNDITKMFFFINEVISLVKTGLSLIIELENIAIAIVKIVSIIPTSTIITITLPLENNNDNDAASGKKSNAGSYISIVLHPTNAKYRQQMLLLVNNLVLWNNAITINIAGNLHM